MKALEIQIGGNHYKSDYEVYEYIGDNMLNYTQGNILKYVTRFRQKNGKEDLTKALHYCEMGKESKEKNIAVFSAEKMRLFITANKTAFSELFLMRLSGADYDAVAIEIRMIMAKLYGNEED